MSASGRVRSLLLSVFLLTLADRLRFSLLLRDLRLGEIFVL